MTKRSVFTKGLPGVWILLSALVLPSQVAAQATKKVSVDSLIYDLKHPESQRKLEAARLLGENQVRSAVPALMEAAKDQDPAVRLEVVKALTKINDPRAIPTYVQLMRDQSVAVQKEAIKGTVDAYVVRESGFLVDVKKVADLVNPFSDDFDPLVVEPYVQVSPDAVSVLGELLGSPDEGIRSAAANALGTLKGRAALPRIESRLAEETSDTVTVELVRSVHKIGDPVAGKALIPLTRASSRKVRDTAIHALGRLRVKEAVPNLTELYSSGIEERKKILGVVPVSGTDEFQKQVFQALSYIGDPSSKALFMEALASPADYYRRFGAEGLARMQAPDEATALGRSYIHESSSKAKLAMSFALYRAGRSEHLDELVGAAGSSQGLHYLMEFDTAEVGKLYPYLKTAQPGVQVGLLEVIGMKGDRSALQLVGDLSGSSNADVASASNLALRRLRGRFQ